MHVAEQLANDLSVIEDRLSIIPLGDDSWLRRCKDFIQSCQKAIPVLVPAHSNLTTIDLLNLTTLEHLAAEAHANNAEAATSLVNYLHRLPGYQPDKLGHQSQVTREKHDYVAMQMASTRQTSQQPV